MNALRNIERDHFSSIDDEVRAIESIGAEIPATDTQHAANTEAYNSYQEHINAAREVRAGLSEIGLSPSQTGRMSDSETKVDGGTAVGRYETGSNVISLARVGIIKALAVSKGISVKSATARIGRHEQRHKHSLTRPGAQRTNHFLIQKFGKKAVHNSQEAMARHRTTDASEGVQLDIYGQEAANAGQYASALKMEYDDFIQAVYDGDHEKLAANDQDDGTKKEAA